MRIQQKSIIGGFSETKSQLMFLDDIAFSILKTGITCTDWFVMYPIVIVLPSGNNLILDLQTKNSDGSDEIFERWNIDFFDVHSRLDAVSFHRCGAPESDVIKLSDVISICLWEEE